MENFTLGNLIFEWDDRKAASNIRNHTVSFPEAATAFLDFYAEMISDPDHSEMEERILLLAMSTTARLLVVVHVKRELRFRIISARRASPKEWRRYDATRFGRR
ncbi:MAG TPA: BrnT family toxin [Acidobacteriaceae bacterium]